MARKISLKAVAIVMVSTAVLVGGLHALRTFQVRRNAHALLAQAGRAREEKEYAKELRYLQTYLSLNPHDAEAQARFAILLCDAARNDHERGRAYFALEAAVRQNPERSDLRHRAVKLALRLKRPSDAMYHLEVLHEEAGKADADIMESMGHVEFQRGAVAKADAWYEQSIRQDPKRITPYIARATLLRRSLKKPDDADKVIEAMTAANPGSPDAEIARIRYTRELKGDASQNEQMRKTLAGLIEQYGKEYPDLFLLAAAVEQEGGDKDARERARALLLKGAELHEKEIAFPLELARLEVRAKGSEQAKSEAALVQLRRIVDEFPLRGVDYLTVVGLLLDAGGKEDAARLVKRIERNDDNAPLATYLDARLAFADGRWLDASRSLDHTRIDRFTPLVLVQAFHLLQAQCYQRLGNPDRQLEAAKASLEQDPFWAPGLIAQAEALSALGQPDEAIRVYESLIGRWRGANLAAAETWVNRNLRVAENLRDWDRPAALLGADGSAPAVRLRARILLARGKSAEAVKTLEDGCKAHPKDVPLWLALAEATDGAGQEEKVSAVLKRAAAAAGDQIEFRLADAQLAGRKDPKVAAPILASAEREAAGKPAEESLRWLRALGNFYLARGDMGAADRILTGRVKARPDDLDVWRGLFDVAAQRGDLDRLDFVVKKIERLEGPEGTLWRYGRAALLVERGKPEDRAAARTWLDEARKRRRSWSPPYVLDGRIAELEGNGERAVAQYTAALERGAVTPEVVGRLAGLIRRQKKYAEANALLTRYEAIIPRSGELGRLASLTSWEARENLEQGLEAALEKLSPTSKDYRDQLLYGQICQAGRRRDEAEKAFLRARELGDKQSECYIALVSFYAEKEPKKAEEVIRLAAANLPPAEAPLALAACHEVMGQKTQAESQYKAALAARGDDPAVLSAAATFYLRAGQLVRAEPLFRKMIADKSSAAQPRVAWARRTLALALGATGDYARYREALALLDQNGQGSAEDHRARALLLARQPHERREAIRQLEAAFARIVPTPEEEFFLVTLLVAERDWTQAQQRMVRLLNSREGNNPVFLVYYLDQLIQRGESDKADPWLKRLEALEPASLRTTGMQARLLQARKEVGRAKDLIRRYADAHAKDPAQQLGVARLLESLGFAADAEPYYRNFASALREKNPRAELPLAGYLGRRNRVAEAMKVCEAVRGKVPDAQLALAYIDILREGQPTKEESLAVKGWLAGAKQKASDPAIFDLALANVSDLQDERSQAIALYRDLVDRDGRNILARNNLAVLLALGEKKFEQALECIDKAIEIDGPQPNLLDTRGIVYLAMRQPTKAIADLEEATQMAPDPASYFRLASAYLQNRDRRSARRALEKARAAGFSLNSLHPLERPAAGVALAALGEIGK